MNNFFKITKSFFKKTKKNVRLRGRPPQLVSFEVIFKSFQDALSLNNRVLELLADMSDKLSGDYIFDKQYINSACQEIADLVNELIDHLNLIAPSKYLRLYEVFQKIDQSIKAELAGRPQIPRSDFTMAYQSLNKDCEALVGAKNANLAELGNHLGVNIPEGFAITTGGFATFMTHNQLWEAVEGIVHDWHNKTKSTEEASAEIKALILQGEIPPALKKAFSEAMQQVGTGTGEGQRHMILRSSAWGEDGESSFAGQYQSLLNQQEGDLLDGYKKVIASLYAATAMAYRLQKGFSESEVVMAVGCQVMVDAKISGVLYTFDPLSPECKRMMATSVWGLGAPLADGRTAADRYLIDRGAPHDAVTMEVAQKREKLIIEETGGTQFVSVPDAEQTIPCLDPSHLKRLAEIGLTIENHFKAPQDIEFAIDQEDQLIILQSRMLNIACNRSVLASQLPAALERHPVVMDKQGTIAQRGIGIGKVYLVRSDEDLEKFPIGAILVSKFTSPRFVKVIGKANGIITDVGSATGHMANIAREFKVPTVVNTQTATRILTPGQEITLDATENKVYLGIIKALHDYHLTEEALENAFEYRLLRRMLKKIGRLNLLDPTAKNFKPSRCRTFHDITRFVHEKLVEELINREYFQSSSFRGNTAKLKISVPLNLVIIDIGNGIMPAKKRSSVTVAEITSLPMAAFTEGVMMPGAWNINPMPVDFGSFMSSMTRTIPTGLSSPQEIGQNMAILSEAYAHISLRLGYHFTMIDSYIDDNANNNYAYFRFGGGVTDEIRRSRRAQLLSEILTRDDFRVEVKSDLVIARIKKLTIPAMKQKLYLLGVLVAFSRQLDVQMSSDQQVCFYADQFKTLMASYANLYKQGEKLP